MNNRYFQTLIYFFTVFANQGLSFVLLFIITRNLSTEAFGAYGIALVVAGLITMLGASWIRNLTLRLYYEAIERKETRSFFVSVFLFQTIVTVSLLAIAFIILNALTRVLIPNSLFFAIVPYILFGNYYSLSITLNRAEDQSLVYSFAEISGGVLRFAGTLFAFSLGFKTAEALIWASALALLIPSVVSTYFLSKKLTGPSGFNFSSLKDVLHYGPSSLPFPVASWFEESADQIVLERLTDKATVGIYNANYALADRLLGVLAKAIFMMSWPNILRAYTEKGVEAAKTAITQSFRLYFWLTVGPMVFIAVYSQLLVNLIGRDFQVGAAIMPLIVVATWLRDVRSYMNRHIELQKRFAILSIVTSIGAVVNLGLNLVLIPRYGLEGAAIATLADFIVVTIIYFFMRDFKFIKIPYLDLVACFALSAVAYSLPRIVAQNVWVEAGGFIFIYALGCFIVLFGETIVKRLETLRDKKSG